MVHTVDLSLRISSSFDETILHITRLKLLSYETGWDLRICQRDM